MACFRAEYDGEPSPEPTATIKALTRARNRAAALEQVAGGTFGVFPYDKDRLVDHGELVPRSMVAGRELGEASEPPQDLSEP
jgi:hypothetical protein